jgi:hypothetical protein
MKKGNSQVGTFDLSTTKDDMWLASLTPWVGGAIQVQYLHELQRYQKLSTKDLGAGRLVSLTEAM